MEFLAAPARGRQLVASKPADDHLPTFERIENQDAGAKITGGAAAGSEGDGGTFEARADQLGDGSKYSGILDIFLEPKWAEFFEQWRDAGDCSLDTAAGRHSFILDSGATVHATGNQRLLSWFTQLPQDVASAAVDDVFSARDGSALRVAGVGDIAMGRFHLPHVRYVPGLGPGSTLVSVPQLAERDYLVVFGGGCCYVKDRAGGGGRLLGKGRLHRDDGCYHLEFLDIPAAAVQEQS